MAEILLLEDLPWAATGDKRRQKKKKTTKKGGVEKAKKVDKKKKTKKGAVEKAKVVVDLCKDMTGFSKVVCKVEDFIFNFEDMQNTLFGRPRRLAAACTDNILCDEGAKG